MELVPEEIEDYASTHSTPLPELLEELVRVTHEKFPDRAGMLTGQVEGLLLQTLAASLGARRILEVGTFTGFSALMMAAALPHDGELVTCDISKEHTDIAREFWARSPHGKKIDLRLGPAVETLKGLRGPFDLAFLDADKENYVNYYEAVLPLLAERGLIAADNVLWSGRVLSPEHESDHAIVAFNKRVQEDSRVSNVLLTVRDGLMMIRRA
jgi:caffeoyl-CoA O-methyltransferase